MSVHIVLQRFAAGQAAAFGYDATLAFLGQYGEIGRGLADQELCFADTGIASSAILVGDQRQGIACILIEEAKAGQGFQAFLFAALQTLGGCAFDDELRAIYLCHASQAEVPDALQQASLSGVHRIVSPAQIWPQQLALPTPGGLRYAAMLNNPNRQGQPFQTFDALDDERRLLRYHFHTHPAACHPAVCRGLRQVMLRIELARRRLSELREAAWRVELSFQYDQAFLAIMEAPAPASLSCAATTVTAAPGCLLDPHRNAFCADFDRVATAEWNAQRCVQQAQQEFGLVLGSGMEGARALDRLLQTVHERVVEAAESEFARELMLRWCWFAGSAFGELVRHAVGAQWGTLPLGPDRHPALRLHSGRQLFPLLRALDKLHRGSEVSLADELQVLLDTARSRIHQFNGHDEVAALPALYQYLIGQRLDTEVPFPLHHALSTAELDGSPQSLLALDRWLRQVAPVCPQLTQQQLTRLVRCAGAYLGEVICRSDPAAWLWENYHDYFDGTPGLPDLPHSLEASVVLRGHGALLFPYAQVLARLTDDSRDDLLTWACANAPGLAEYAEHLRQAGQHGRGPDFFNTFSEHSAGRLAAHLPTRYPQLDGELVSVAELDRLIAALDREQTDAAELAELLGQFACYAGDLAVRHRGARWRSTGQTRLAGRSSSPIVLQTAAGSVLDPFATAFRALRLGGSQRLENLLLMVNNEAKVLANLPAQPSPTPSLAKGPGLAPRPPAAVPAGTAAAPSTAPRQADDAASRRLAAEATAAVLLANARRSAQETRAAPGGRLPWVLMTLVAPMGGLAAAVLHSTLAGLLVAGLAVAGGLWLRRHGF
jgi:hypothetical protein